jgi:hypothetical protein
MPSQRGTRYHRPRRPHSRVAGGSPVPRRTTRPRGIDERGRGEWWMRDIVAILGENESVRGLGGEDRGTNLVRESSSTTNSSVQPSWRLQVALDSSEQMQESAENSVSWYCGGRGWTRTWYTSGSDGSRAIANARCTSQVSSASGSSLYHRTVSSRVPRKRPATDQRSVRYNSVIPTNARLALLLSSPSSSASNSVPAPPSAPSLACSITANLACRIVSALAKWLRDSSGDESWAR